jgi:hypothetical protein
MRTTVDGNSATSREYSQSGRCEHCDGCLTARRGKLNGALDRHEVIRKKRGEITPKVMDVLEVVLAPIYPHGLFLGPLRDASVDRLVDRALALVCGK